MLDEPGALERPGVWEAGLNKVWKSLVEGGRLKNFLPLRAVVCHFSPTYLIIFDCYAVGCAGQDPVRWLA